MWPPAADHLTFLPCFFWISSLSHSSLPQPYPRTSSEEINEETRVTPRLADSVERKNMDILFSCAASIICKTKVTPRNKKGQDGTHLTTGHKPSPVMSPSHLNLVSSWLFLSYLLKSPQLGENANLPQISGDILILDSKV